MSTLKTSILITKGGFLVGVILFFVYFTSYLIFTFLLTRYITLSNEWLILFQASVHFVIAATLIIASFFIQRINKLHLIYTSSIAASIATIFFFFALNEFVRLAIILAVAIFFSMGLLASFTYFWGLTSPEERGRVAGLTGFVFLPIYYITVQVATGALDFLGIITLSAIIALIPLGIILLQPHKKVITSKNDSRVNYFEKRTLLFYLVPWLLFSLVNAILAKNTSFSIAGQVSSSFYVLLVGLQVVGVIFGALIGGFVADFFGRRLSLALSLTLYGASSAFVGLIQNNSIFALVYVTNGLSWGFLLILYTFVVWGDLATKENCAKLYAIGLAIYYSALGFGSLSTQITQIPLVITALASCFLIFIANIPIILAPELLPADFRDKIRLRFHMNAVKKIGKKAKNQG